MKSWFVVSVVVFVLGACVPLALAAGIAVEEVRYAAHIPEGKCEAYPLRPFTPHQVSIIDGSVIAHITNEGEAASGRVCVFDGAGVKRMDLAVTFAAREQRDIVFETPPGVYTFRSEFENAGAKSYASGTMNTEWCLSHSEDFDITFYVGPEGSGGSSSGGGCVPGALAVGLAGLFTSGVTFALGKFPGLGALLLYSRLAKPRLLDSAVRNKVFDLIANEPGIHSRQLVRGLDAADGQTAYHLGVLAREKLLVSVGVPGMRHWFVTGRFTSEQMRAIASLRDPTRRRVYEAVVADPGASLTSVSEIVGVSMPQGSRAARALERAGLIERRTAGRALSLRALREPRDVYGAHLKRADA